MKSKILLLLLFICLGVNINAFAYESNIDEKMLTKMCVENNDIDFDLDVDGCFGEVNIKNDHFDICYEFECYYLSSAAISYNTIILESNDLSVEYLGLDFEENCFNYIVKYNNTFLYSSIDFSDLSCEINLCNADIKNELINNSMIDYSDSPNQYSLLKERAQRAYSFFKVSRNTANINTKSVQDITITGDGAFDVNLLIENGALNQSYLTTEGVNYGMMISEVNQIQQVSKIYALDTTYDDLWDEHYTYMKIWDVDYNTSTASDGDLLLTIDIEDTNDILIIWNEDGVEASCANPGYAFFETENVSFMILTSGYSYISRFQARYTYETAHDTHQYVRWMEKLVAKFISETEHVNTAAQILNFVLQTGESLYDYYNQIYYDSLENEFVITDGNDNARIIGFSISKDDVESGLFAEYKLDSFSYRMIYKISNFGNTMPYFNMNFGIVPINTNQILQFNWNFNSTGLVCSHQKAYQYIDTQTHLENCSECHYSYYNTHNVSYDNLGSSGHSIHCNLCSKTESHTLVNNESGTYCMYCDYFVEHTHDYTYSYSQSGTLNHIAYCSCGASKTETHIFQSFKNGNRCTKCLYFTTGPVIIQPIMGISNEIMYIEENKKENYFYV